MQIGSQIQSRNVRRILIPCGGFGTRLLPATKAIPKALLPVFDRPLLQHAVEEAVRAGFTEIVVLHRADQTAIAAQLRTPGPLAEQLDRLERPAEREALESFDSLADIRLFANSDESLGLGGQILEMEEFLRGEAFALLFVDELCDPGQDAFAPLRAGYDSHGLTIVAARLGPQAPLLGRVESIPDLAASPASVSSPGESHAPRLLGRMICAPAVLTALRAWRETVPGPLDLMDALRLLAGQKLLLACRYDGRWWDCGSRAGYLEANLALALADGELGPRLRTVLAGS